MSFSLASRVLGYCVFFDRNIDYIYISIQSLMQTNVTTYNNKPCER